MLPTAPRNYYALQQRVNKTARNEVARLWRQMGSDFESGWRRIGPRIFDVISAAQLTVARESIPYLGDLAEQTTESDVVGVLNPGSLAGVASDGRPLDTLAYGAVVRSGEAFNAGASQTQALKAGGLWLDLMTTLQVADAARTATSIGACVRPEWGGYVRYLNPPSCSRCAVLAGKWFKWNEGFRRHPRCDCQHFPARNASYAESEGFIGNPDDAWRNGHIKDLTKKQRMALEDGADLSQIINARRGMSTTTTIKGTRFDFTLEGTTKRGVYGRSDVAAGAGYTATDVGQRGYVKNYIERRTQRSRITPETIYRIASDRADAVRLLRSYGYILP